MRGGCCGWRCCRQKEEPRRDAGVQLPWTCLRKNWTPGRDDEEETTEAGMRWCSGSLCALGLGAISIPLAVNRPNADVFPVELGVFISTVRVTSSLLCLECGTDGINK
ncbi:hypothetical protein GN956_G20753 [Arapaima gigas]